jgi:IclR family pca regulon transcriptional regulator
MEAPLRSVQRAMQLLEALSRAQEPMPLHALSAELSLGKATVRRFLLTFEQLGYVMRDTRGAYRLAGRIRLAQGLRPAADDEVRAALRELSREAGVATSISRLDGADVVYLYREPPGIVAGVPLEEGARLPAHATAIGKVLLAHRPAEELWQRYPGGRLPAATERTITELPMLLGALQEIRRQGWALSDGELEEGLCAAAVPIYRADGRLLCALNASATGGSRSREAFVTEILPALLRYRQRLAALLADT